LIIIVLIFHDKFDINFRWEFLTQNYDIDFGVFFNGNDKKTAVVPMSKVNSHTIAEDGFITCKKTGVCK